MEVGKSVISPSGWVRVCVYVSTTRLSLTIISRVYWNDCEVLRGIVQFYYRWVLLNVFLSTNWDVVWNWFFFLINRSVRSFFEMYVRNVTFRFFTKVPTAEIIIMFSVKGGNNIALFRRSVTYWIFPFHEVFHSTNPPLGCRVIFRRFSIISSTLTADECRLVRKKNVRRQSCLFWIQYISTRNYFRCGNF